MEKWNQVWGVEPRSEWVHMFIHTLGKVPAEWYLETELRRGTSEWSALVDSFILTFSFEGGLETVGQALIINAPVRETMHCRHLAHALTGPSIPLNFRQMHSMLSLVGYYRKHIPQYELITVPMTRLLRRGATFQWDDEC